MQSLECVVCLEAPRGKIFQCQNGHLTCETCDADLRRPYAKVGNVPPCPVCRVKLPVQPIRNLAAENVILEAKEDVPKTISAASASLQSSNVEATLDMLTKPPTPPYAPTDLFPSSSLSSSSHSPAELREKWLDAYAVTGGPRPDQLQAYGWFTSQGWDAKWPLHRAAMTGDVYTIEKLTSGKGGRDPNEKMTSWFDSEPLGWAASLGQLAAVIALIKVGADPSRPANKAGNTPLSDAQREGHGHVIAFLSSYSQSAWLSQSASAPSAPSEMNRDSPGSLVIHEARYGWARDIWAAAKCSHKAGCKDVTSIVRADVQNEELHINPGCAPQFMNMHFWPETRHGPAIPRKLSVRYSYGAGPVMEVLTPAVPHETVALHVTASGATPSAYPCSGPVRMVPASPDDHTKAKQIISTKDISGCWACACVPGGCAVFSKTAKGPDELLHAGLVMLFCVIPCWFMERRFRHAGTNGFYKEGEPHNVDLHTSKSFASNGPAASCKLCC
mmetsp:Transcript_1551/g.5697  ORF Transcript_1551/g.5697 Transcript_1551/m.5697 type:complete len:501 (-) Transcript_1551:839-2341(-)